MTDYSHIYNTQGRQAAMSACWRDIQDIYRRNWDCFAVADFYNEMILAYGTCWKCVRWTSNNDIVCVILQAWDADNSFDIVYMARYDKNAPAGYKSAKWITTNTEDRY